MANDRCGCAEAEACCEGFTPSCEDFEANVFDRESGEDLCEESGLDDEASCTACGKCCEWDGSRCTYNLKPNGKPHSDCPRKGGSD